MRTFLSVTAAALLAALTLTLTAAPTAAADDKPEDTPKAAKTRKLLKTKIEVDFKDERLEDAMDEIKNQVKGLSYRLDSKGGVSRNSKLSYTAKGKTVEQVLDEMFTKAGLGYYVISDKKNPYDGGLWVKQGKERGYPGKK